MIELSVNGTKHKLDIEGDTPLLWVLRDELNLLGTKYGCGLAQCGACSVFLNGQLTRSCMFPIEAANGASITTIEAIEEDQLGKEVVKAWVAHQVPQCGYCQSGQVMAATSLLQSNPSPSEEDIANTMSNLCRCGTYNAVKEAIQSLSKPGDK